MVHVYFIQFVYGMINPPKKWDKLTIMTITDAVIKTAEQLQKDDNT